MSELQQEASRANGAKSRGPITEEGKQASSQNRRTHGLLSKKIVLEGESQEEFDALFNSYLEEHQPETPTERSLIESMAAARWRQERVWSLETAAMDNQIRRPRYHEAEEDFASQAYLAFHTLTNAGPSFELLSRYEVRHERQFRAALNTFLSLRTKRTVAERIRNAAEPAPERDWDPPVPTHTWDGEKRVPVCPVPVPEPEPIPEPNKADELAPAAVSGSFGKTAEPPENKQQQPACHGAILRKATNNCKPAVNLNSRPQPNRWRDRRSRFSYPVVARRSRAVGKLMTGVAGPCARTNSNNHLPHRFALAKSTLLVTILRRGAS